MNIFESIFEKLPQYREIKQLTARRELPVLAVGISSVHKAHVIQGICAGESAPALVLTSDEQIAKRLSDDFNQMAGSEASAVFPLKDLTLRPVETVSREYEYIRLGVLSRLMQGDLKVVFSSISAALQYTIPKGILSDSVICIKADSRLEMKKLINSLTGAGYERRPQVDGAGQFSARGGILDFFPTGSQEPVRIEFWGDQVDSISYFDLDSQRRTEHLKEVRITPASEILYDRPALVKQLDKLTQTLGSSPHLDKARQQVQQDLRRLNDCLGLTNIDKYIGLIYSKPATLFDYFTGGLMFACEWTDIQESARASEAQIDEDIRILLEEGHLMNGLDQFYHRFELVKSMITSGDTVFLDTFAHSHPDLKIKKLLSVSALQTSGWSGETKLLLEDLEVYREQGYSVLVLTGTAKHAKILLSDLDKQGYSAVLARYDTELQPGIIHVMEGSLSSGFEYAQAKAAIITQSKKQQSSRKRTKRRKGEEIKSLSDIQRGDLVVHSSHGIGVFDKIEKLEVQGICKDYIKIKYSGSDVLYVPVTQLDMVSKYIGTGEQSRVKLNKLNSGEWTRTRSRAKKAVAEMAEELIRLYAEREKVKGYAFSPDNDWQREFESRFEYEETEDQLICADEIKQDMQSPKPMERLLCGDVGFGKTEVALRAAFKCVLDSKQCAILCPTTILAWQHYQTVIERIGSFPVNVELLSRFRTPKQQREIVQKLKNGQIDIIIGTHRLVQKDILFKDLGLAVIDEEQRFGVKHKERFKEMFRQVDVLMLSATPIPRTLNMAMSGIRDMSVLEQPPQDRHPIQTYVMEHDEGVLLNAIMREVRRNGQVYYIHNRIETIHECAARLQERLPDVRIGVAHGRMNELQLSKIWKQLMDHEVDMLICTTIIETGVDVPNCNTLIIEDADRMGLSQMYQLRGRVGRSKRRAFAYFTFRRGKVLTEISSKRLEAIREFTKFGSGFRIALRDLEIRGAGSVLGESQHGHMAAVGYDMYIKLLSDAVSEKRGELPPTRVEECLVDIPIEAHIPEQYIENLSQRLDVYRKIAAVQSQEQKMDLLDELIDRFGEPPKSVQGLLDIAILRAAAANLGFVEITQSDSQMLFYPKTLDMEVAGRLAERLSNRVVVKMGAKPSIAVKMNGETSLTIIREVLNISGDIEF